MSDLNSMVLASNWLGSIYTEAPVVHGYPEVAGDAVISIIRVRGTIVQVGCNADGSGGIWQRRRDPATRQWSAWEAVTMDVPNEPPTAIYLNPNVCDSDAGANTVVGELTADDPNAFSDFTYEMSDPYFHVQGATVYKSNAQDSPVGPYPVQVTVTDSGGATFTSQVIIDVTA